MNLRHLVLLLSTALVCAAAGAAAGVSTEVEVVGAVKLPLRLTVQQLQAFAAADQATASVVRKVDDKEITTTVRGVRLTAVLERAGLVEADRHGWRRSVVLVTATDGYKVAFSLPELTNTEVGSAVLLVYERDGQPLADREGRIALVSARDQRSGPRSVRWLSRIEVRLLD